ncbi:S4 domain-containing protein [Oerskovia sp. M15]
MAVRPPEDSGPRARRAPVDRAADGRAHRAPRPRSGAGRGWAGDAQAGKSTPRAAPRPQGPQRDVHVADGVRLQKVLATAGIGSRRACEDLITAGRVEVDGVLVRELGVRVDPVASAIHVDGMRIQLDQSLVTIALNKPLGVVSTMHDPEGVPRSRSSSRRAPSVSSTSGVSTPTARDCCS